MARDRQGIFCTVSQVKRMREGVHEALELFYPTHPSSDSSASAASSLAQQRGGKNLNEDSDEDEEEEEEATGLSVAEQLKKELSGFKRGGEGRNKGTNTGEGDGERANCDDGNVNHRGEKNEKGKNESFAWTLADSGRSNFILICSTPQARQTEKMEDDKEDASIREKEVKKEKGKSVAARGGERRDEKGEDAQKAEMKGKGNAFTSEQPRPTYPYVSDPYSLVTSVMELVKEEGAFGLCGLLDNVILAISRLTESFHLNSIYTNEMEFNRPLFHVIETSYSPSFDGPICVLYHPLGQERRRFRHLVRAIPFERICQAKQDLIEKEVYRLLCAKVSANVREWAGTEEGEVKRSGDDGQGSVRYCVQLKRRDHNQIDRDSLTAALNKVVGTKFLSQHLGYKTIKIDYKRPDVCVMVSE